MSDSKCLISKCQRAAILDFFRIFPSNASLSGGPEKAFPLPPEAIPDDQPYTVPLVVTPWTSPTPWT